MPQNQAYETTLEHQPSVADKNHVISKLIGFNDSQAVSEGIREITLFTRCQGELVGGLLGFTHWNWLFVKQLWVCDSVRHLGIGTELMHHAEIEATQRSCLHAHLDTFDFQALPFYEKLGYKIFGQLDDYPVGHTRYFLRKKNL